MAVAALIALIHDLTITVGVYALVGFEVTPGTVIGLLTILGYSLYDTVVVFDTSRRTPPTAAAQLTYSEVANRGLNQHPGAVHQHHRGRAAAGRRAAVHRRRPARRRHAERHLALRCSSASPPVPTPRSSSPPRWWRTSRSAAADARRWTSGSRSGARRRAAAGPKAGRPPDEADVDRDRRPRTAGRPVSARAGPRRPGQGRVRRALAGSDRVPRPGAARAGPPRTTAAPPPTAAPPRGRGAASMTTPDAARTELLRRIRDVPDYPKPGVMFKDITPLLADAEAFAALTDALAELARARRDQGRRPGGARLHPGRPGRLRPGSGFVPVRKAGKLPGATLAQSYDLEYGSATIEVHQRRLRPGRPGPGHRRRAGHRRHRRGLAGPGPPGRRRAGRRGRPDGARLPRGGAAATPPSGTAGGVTGAELGTEPDRPPVDGGLGGREECPRPGVATTGGAGLEPLVPPGPAWRGDGVPTAARRPQNEARARAGTEPASAARRDRPAPGPAPPAVGARPPPGASGAAPGGYGPGWPGSAASAAACSTRSWSRCCGSCGRRPQGRPAAHRAGLPGRRALAPRPEAQERRPVHHPPAGRHHDPRRAGHGPRRP